jgi:murein DD-endopeptidase MepM/ murein hydrolase activator NlpD
MKKNIRNIFSIIILLLLVFGYILPLNVYAESSPQTLGDLKNELAALKKKKSDNEASQKYTESQIKQREQAIINAEAEITQAEGEIETAEENINDSNEKIDELTEKVKKLLVFTQQMKSENAYLEYVTGASTITDLIMRIKAIEQTTQSSQETIENLENLIKENEQLKVDLQKKQESLSAKITSYQATIESLYGDLESYDKYALDIDTQIKTMQTQVDSYVKLCASSSKSYLGDDELLTDCTVVPYNAGWLKPLKKGTITSTIGSRWGSYHNALDIGGNAEGTPVYAAAAGTVAGFVSRYRCGGNMLYINVTVGGVKYTTYYYHLLTVNVKVGDVVTQNTVIGTVGGYSTATNHGGYDSCTTGAHLHFGVAKGYYTGSISKANVITPPGFPNKSGYKFTSRTDYYG